MLQAALCAAVRRGSAATGKRDTRRTARRSEAKCDRRPSGENSAGCGRLREGVPDGDGRYSALNQTACIRESMAHLTTKRRREFGAAREPNAGSATCNGGKCREARREAWRWRCSREELAPEGNLVIVERGEDKADAPQASRLNAARHFPLSWQALKAVHDTTPPTQANAR